MTVKELIEKLREYPENACVVTNQECLDNDRGLYISYPAEIENVISVTIKVKDKTSWGWGYRNLEYDKSSDLKAVEIG